MTVVYLAGKMGSGNGACDCGYAESRPHDWIEHEHGCGTGFSEGNWRLDIVGEQPILGRITTFRSGYTYGGPWYIDRSNHGLEIDHVAGRCMGWVRDSGAVFAWISALDAHGTFAEIGYAKALGKPLFVAFDRDRISEDQEREVWFIRQLADEHCSVRNAGTAFAIFTHWLAARNAARLTYGSRW